MIRINHVDCYKGSHHILKNINLDIKENEKIAIIGPSGAGKTTLFRMLTKIEEDYTGDIQILNRSIREYTDNKSYATLVGTIAQGNHLIENLKVKHNVAIGLFNRWSFFTALSSLFKLKEKEKISGALKKVHMLRHIDKKVSDLSGGEKQRIAISRLLLQNPLLILADEPIAALDPKLARQSIELLLDHTQGKTLLMILHHTEFATAYFDRIIALKEGQIYFDKKAKEVTPEMLGELYE